MMLTFGEDTERDFLQIYGKRCWNKALKPPSNDLDSSQRMFWHNNGPSEDVNSLSILIHWLTHEGNYVKWKGGNRHLGVTKNTLASNIVAEMKRKGIATERTAKDVTQKILVMEQNFKKAINFLDGTSDGITDKESLAATVRKNCPYYYKLEPVMSNRQCSHPLATEEDISHGETDDNKEEKEIETVNQEEENKVVPEIEYSGEQKGEELGSEL